MRRRECGDLVRHKTILSLCRSDEATAVLSTYTVSKLHFTATSSHYVSSADVREDDNLVLAVFGADKKPNINFLAFLRYNRS